MAGSASWPAAGSPRPDGSPHELPKTPYDLLHTPPVTRKTAPLKFEEPLGAILWITTESTRHCAMLATHTISLSALECSTTLAACWNTCSAISQQLLWQMTT